MKISRRPAKEDDRAFALLAHHAGYHDVSVRQFGAWNETLQDGFFESDWEVPPHEILLYGDVPCGYVAIDKNPDHLFIREIIVHPDFQGRKIGTTIIKETLEEASRQNLPVKLQVLHQNNALNLYSKLGFVEYGRTDTHILMERRNP